MVAVAIQARNAQPLPKQYLGKHFTPEKEQALRALQRPHNAQLHKRSLAGKIAPAQAAKNQKEPALKSHVHGLYGKHVYNLRKRSLGTKVAAAHKAAQELAKSGKFPVVKHHIHVRSSNILKL